MTMPQYAYAAPEMPKGMSVPAQDMPGHSVTMPHHPRGIRSPRIARRTDSEPPQPRDVPPAYNPSYSYGASGDTQPLWDFVTRDPFPAGKRAKSAGDLRDAVAQARPAAAHKSVRAERPQAAKPLPSLPEAKITPEPWEENQRPAARQAPAKRYRWVLPEREDTVPPTRSAGFAQWRHLIILAAALFLYAFPPFRKLLGV